MGHRHRRSPGRAKWSTIRSVETTTLGRGVTVEAVVWGGGRRTMSRSVVEGTHHNGGSSPAMSSTANRPFHRGRRHPSLRFGALVGALVVTLGGLAIDTDALGAGHLFDRAVAEVDRLIAGPAQDRPTVATVFATPRPAASPGPNLATYDPPISTARPSGAAVSTPTAEPTPEPTPAPVAVDVDIAADPAGIFASEVKDTWCAPAGVQITLAYLGKADTSIAFQRELQGRVHEWESYADSHNGGWGPAAMAQALAAYGVPGYQVRTYKTRQGALLDAATAIETTGSPAILLAWRGAHTWVMTGFRADADPAIFPDATIDGAYIVDPWYPRVSSIWGPSDPPGTFQDKAEMIRNYLAWKRPEGKYPGRDGRFIAVVPTVKVGAGD